ncbi:glycosyltransferase family 4 protein [Aerococcus sp. L_32]|uniref:glycosyltransferase family 4 protein n=1 Tax=Aerococcus sp. L_32 TaxID=3422316 RepID=UPI003D6C6B1D
MSKHILVYSQYFYPEQFRINDLCLELVERGFKVSVVTGVPNYPEGRFYKGYSWRENRNEIWNGINIYRMPIFSRGQSKIRLILNYFSFVISSKLLERTLPKDIDAIFTYEVSPMTQALPAIWYAKKMKVPSYLYVMDLWPENVVAVTKIKNKIIIDAIGRMVDYIYKNTTTILASSERFVDAIVNRNVPEKKILYWPQYAEDLYEIKEKNNQEVISEYFDEMTFVFAGNVGEAQGLGILPEAAKHLMEIHIKVKFVIIGNGRYMSQLLDLIKKLGVSEYFYFIPRQPATDIPYYLAKFDVALITLNSSEIYDMTIPAKTQSLMACGKPLLVAANGEVQEIVRNSASGLYGDAGDVEKLVSNIIKFYEMTEKDLERLSKNSKKYYDTNFDKKQLMDKLEWLLRGC